MRDECLNAHWFLSLADTRAKIEAWRRDYNETLKDGRHLAGTLHALRVGPLWRDMRYGK